MIRAALKDVTMLDFFHSKSNRSLISMEIIKLKEHAGLTPQLLYFIWRCKEFIKEMEDIHLLITS